MNKSQPTAKVGRTAHGYNRPVSVCGVVMGHASFAKCSPVSWWNYQPNDGSRLRQYPDLSRVREAAVCDYLRSAAQPGSSSTSAQQIPDATPPARESRGRPTVLDVTALLPFVEQARQALANTARADADYLALDAQQKRERFDRYQDEDRRHKAAYDSAAAEAMRLLLALVDANPTSGVAMAAVANPGQGARR